MTEPVGPLRLFSSGGGITVIGGRSAEVVAESSHAGVSVDFTTAPTRVEAESSAGDVTVILPRDEALYAVDASSSGDDPTVDVRIDPTSNRSIRVHSSSGKVVVRYR